MSSGITVQGVGEVKATPDLATVLLGAEATAPTVAEARDRGAEAASKLIAAVKSNGVADADIQTVTIALNPQYDYSPSGGTPRIVAYVSTNTVRVTVRKLETMGRVVDAALAAAGDAGRLQGITFGFDKRDSLLAEAREKAMADAKTRAEAFAAGGGVKVGNILSIAEAVSQDGVYYPIARDAAAFAEATPIEPGQSTTTVTVTVRYAIDR